MFSFSRRSRSVFLTSSASVFTMMRWLLIHVNKSCRIMYIHSQMQAETKAWARQILKSCQLSLKAHTPPHPPITTHGPLLSPSLFFLEMLAGRWIEAPHFHMKWAASSDLLSPGKVYFSSSCEKAWWDCDYEYSCRRVPCQSVKESRGRIYVSSGSFCRGRTLC